MSIFGHFGSLAPFCTILMLQTWYRETLGTSVTMLENETLTKGNEQMFVCTTFQPLTKRFVEITIQKYFSVIPY